jgi:surface antigen
MSPVCKLALPLALWWFAVHPASAQMGPAWDTYVTLTQGDMNQIRTILSEQIHNKRPGTSVPWKNAESGNWGQVTLLKAFVRRGQKCEQIEYRMSPPQGTPSDRFVLTSCMQPDGKWKLS